ncbi:MBL fold metallo-hydrolase, partial [Acinetobacter baumannii]|nr:MBL fold metallo-hydrolase [Acinetobacter baumannii]
SGRAAVCDPGGDLYRIQAALKEQGVTLEKILLTHGHLDHCAGAAALSREFGVPIEGPHRDEQFWIDQLPEQTKRFGFGHAEAFEPDR